MPTTKSKVDNEILQGENYRHAFFLQEVKILLEFGIQDLFQTVIVEVEFCFKSISPWDLKS